MSRLLTIVRRSATHSKRKAQPFAALLALACAAAFAACGSDTGKPGVPAVDTDDTPAMTTPQTTTQADSPGDAPVRADGGEPEVEVVARGLDVPWDIAFLPDGGGALVTERSGSVRLIDGDGRLQDQPVAVTDVRDEGEAGLMGIALDPEFGEGEPYAYMMATVAESNQLQRWEWDDGRLERDAVLIDDIPGAPNHDGGTLRFGPDGDLYVPTGDAGRKERAQDRANLAGKILRLTPEEYRGDDAVDDPTLHSIGHRNPQGLSWQPGSGRLFASEHGPSGWDGPGGDDEVNVVREGGNYGWPRVQGEASAAGLTGPVWLWGDAVAPSGASFVSREGSSWTGDLLVATLRGSALRKLDVDGGRITGEDKVVEDFGRIRAVVEAPDGTIWITTSNRDEYGQERKGDDRVIRVIPPS
jgi:glucose/arabinose dehydrogenase